MSFHSFGGHAMDRYLIDFDTDDGIGVPDAGGTQGPSPETAADPALEGAAGEVVPPAAATETQAPPAPTLDPLEVRAELESLRAQNQELVAFLNQFGTDQGAQVAEQPSLDPFADDFGQQFQTVLASERQQTLTAIKEMLSPVTEAQRAQQEAQTLQEGDARLNDMLADDVARNGEFAADPDADRQARQLVRTLAEQQFPEIASRFGNTPGAAEIAMGRAAEQVRNLLRSVAGQATAAQTNQLATLAGVKGEPGTTAAGLQGAPEFTDPRQVVDYFATKAHSLNAA